MAVDLLVNRINAIMGLDSFPTLWKMADVIMAPKASKDKSPPENHRLISVLSYVPKVAKQVILSRPRDEILELAPIPDEQFDFSAGLSADIFRRPACLRRFGMGLEIRRQLGRCSWTLPTISTVSGIRGFFSRCCGLALEGPWCA